MSDAVPGYGFFSELARIINAGQSRSIILSGSVHDLFFVKSEGAAGEYAPLINFLCQKCAIKGITLLVVEQNGPIRILPDADREKLKAGWVGWKSGLPPEQLSLQSLTDRTKQRDREVLEADFEENLRDAIGKPTFSLEFLRQLTICSRAMDPSGRPYIPESLLIIIEGADLVLPAGDGDISHLSPPDRSRVSIVQDWLSDPGFMAGEDTVVLLAESRSLIHPRISRLPQVLTVEVPSPDYETRRHYIASFLDGCKPAALGQRPVPTFWAGVDELASFTAGLSIHALRQLLIGAAHSGRALTPEDVIRKVEEFICSQLGEDVIEFKKPTHSLDDVIGFSKLKDFIRRELLPRFRSSGPDALPGAAVAGAIGGGKTFIFEAAAAALDLPVLVLKNIRSMWFGQTDVIFERLRRVLEALVKVVIFVDEADTQFGGVGEGVHETERRLTGKIQQMMSDPSLRGRVIWLLMTARIHLLSPDIRRPGRVGDLIVPVLDPEGEDRKAFLQWVLSAALSCVPDDATVERLDRLTPGYSAAAFTSLRSQLKARAQGGPLTIEAIEEIVRDNLLPAIELTRRYQTLQALVNCTRRSLLPDPTVTEETRQAWQLEIRKLDALGIQ
ncbi:MAG: ATP-binding protein [Planctomycetes bacterium]|nr:ATP-binding protein [Planctomycetota bacterium]